VNPSDFHKSLTDLIGIAQKFPKLFWAMLRHPDTTLARNLSFPSSHSLPPGAFLFINLLLSDVLSAASLITPEHDNGWFSIALRESSSHIIGTLLLVLVLKLAFRQVELRKLFSMVCLSSVVFIPYTLVSIINSLLLGPVFRHYWVSFMSQQFRNYLELLRPTPLTVFKLILSLGLLSAVIIWWFSLLLIASGHISKNNRRGRTLRLTAALSSYLAIFFAIFITYYCYGLWSIFTQCSDYDRMKSSFASANYPEAFLFSSSVTKTNNLLPPIAEYRASLIQAVSYYEVFWKDDHTFDGAIEDIKSKNYSKAQSNMLTQIHDNIHSQTDAKRVVLSGMQSLLDHAEEVRNSPSYSEDETQTVAFLFKLSDIPIAFFP